ncbi:MAG: PEP-CTERM sorting domain-containing protein [Planctomycetota bacterium]
MRIPLTVAALTLALISADARAQRLQFSFGDITASGDVLTTITLDVTGFEGTFDTFEISVEPCTSAVEFIQLSSSLVIAPSNDTGFSAFLIAPMNFGGQALTPFGIVDTTSLVSGTFASLGNNSASTQGNYDVAYIVTGRGPGAGWTQANFFDDGVLVDSFGGLATLCPEPTSLLLSTLGCLGLFVRRSRWEPIHA